MSLTSFVSDVCSVEIPEVLTSLLLDHKISLHLSIVDLGRGFDICCLHPMINLRSFDRFEIAFNIYILKIYDRRQALMYSF